MQLCRKVEGARVQGSRSRGRWSSRLVGVVGWAARVRRGTSGVDRGPAKSPDSNPPSSAASAARFAPSSLLLVNHPHLPIAHLCPPSARSKTSVRLTCRCPFRHRPRWFRLLRRPRPRLRPFSSGSRPTARRSPTRLVASPFSAPASLATATTMPRKLAGLRSTTTRRRRLARHRVPLRRRRTRSGARRSPRRPARRRALTTRADRCSRRSRRLRRRPSSRERMLAPSRPLSTRTRKTVRGPGGLLSLGVAQLTPQVFSLLRPPGSSLCV